MVLAQEPAGLAQNVACIEQGRGDDSASDAPISQPFLTGVSRLEHLSSFEPGCRRFWRAAECWRTTKYGQAKKSKSLSLTEAKKIATIDKINS